MPDPTFFEILRRMVLSERDGYSGPVRTYLLTLGFDLPGGTAQIRGRELTVFLGGTGEGSAPDVGQRLLEDIGGAVRIGSNPIDRWWEWVWEAPLHA